MGVLFYYISDRKQFPGHDSDQRQRLLEKIDEAARAGVDYIQLREKDLTAKELERLATTAKEIIYQQGNSPKIRNSKSETKLLINSRTDIALSVGADGVHLRSSDISAADARGIALRLGRRDLIVAVSCHSAEELLMAESSGADFAVLAPVFGKAILGNSGIGTEPLRQYCGRALPDARVEAGDMRSRMPVLALGGVTVENARQCIRSGAAGIAGIRLFQENDVAKVVCALRD